MKDAIALAELCLENGITIGYGRTAVTHLSVYTVVLEVMENELLAKRAGHAVRHAPQGMPLLYAILHGLLSSDSSDRTYWLTVASYMIYQLEANGHHFREGEKMEFLRELQLLHQGETLYPGREIFTILAESSADQEVVNQLRAELHQMYD